MLQFVLLGVCLLLLGVLVIPRILNARNSSRRLVDQLEKLQFYKYAKKEEIEYLKRLAIRDGVLFVPELGRCFSVVVKDLAGGGASMLLCDLDRFLGLPSDEILDIWDDSGQYFVEIKRQPYLISAESHLEVLRNTVKLINHLLQEVRSRERAYWLDGEEYGDVVLLTNEQYKVIHDTGGHSQVPQMLD